MNCFFNFSPLRFPILLMGAVFVSLDAGAQTYGPAPDPFTPANRGENIATSNGIMSSGRYDINYPGNGSILDVVMVNLPPRPPALGEDGYVIVATSFQGDAAGFPLESFYGALVLVRGRPALFMKEHPVADYRTRYEKLLREIKATFEEMGDASPQARRTSLSNLAARQEGELQALAREAEKVRRDLAWVDRSYGPDVSRSPTGDQSKKALLDPFRLMEAACYFEGLSAEQRALLTEVAYETQSGLGRASGDGGEYFDFLPATARIHLPPNLPPALKEKITAFTDQKNALKNELRSEVLHEDYSFARARTRRLAALAESQAPRFVALELLAEDIRVGLAEFGDADLPVASKLSAELTQRVGDFQVRKAEAQRELLARLRQVQKQFPELHFDMAREGEGLAIVQTTGAAKSVPGLAEFNAGLARRYAAFAGESQILRRDIQLYTESVPGPMKRTVSELAQDFANAYAARETRNRYRDYARAVLEPGLSPAQRHVLFQSAVVNLMFGNRTPQS